MKTTDPIPLGTDRFSVMCWLSPSNGNRWQYIIIHYRRTRFRRSGREGWRKLGFSTMHKGRNETYETRKDALTAGKKEAGELAQFEKRMLIPKNNS